MTQEINKFEFKDYELTKSWWDHYKEQAPEYNTMPDTSYIMYNGDEPILSVSLYLTNGSIAWIDNYIGNPKLKGSIRKECGSILLKHLNDVAKKNAKDRLFCMSMNEKTSKRYIELGFTKTASNISTFIRGVE
jgi:hypothetical protein